MHTRKIGPLEVSAIGLGCMNMSSGYGPGDDEKSKTLLNAALDDGYTFLDTAAMYGKGHNETLIGNSLKTRRQEYVLATKCGLSPGASGKPGNGRPEVLKRECDESLQRLQTDVIDLYYLHRRDPVVPLRESVGALGDLIDAGKVRTIGLSEVSTEQLRDACVERPITALQSEYSLWSRTPERSILHACKELDIAFVPFSPLGRQFLTGKAVDVTQLPDNDLRSTIARPRFEPDNFLKNAELLGPFAEIAESQGCSMAQLALAWLLARHERTMVPIPGTKHIDYMRENAGAGDIELSDDVVATLDELINEDTVAGNRYSDERMEAADSERD